MTQEEWYLNPGNYARLNEILQDPVVKEVFNIIKDDVIEREDGIELVLANRNAADASYVLSSFHSMRAGMNRVFTRLNKLSKPPKAKKAIKEPFEHVTETTNS